MAYEWKEDQASLPIRIKHKLLPVTASHNISKAEVIHMDARCPNPASKHGLAICVFIFMRAVELLATVQTAYKGTGYLADFRMAMHRSSTSSGTCSSRASAWPSVASLKQSLTVAAACSAG